MNLANMYLSPFQFIIARNKQNIHAILVCPSTIKLSSKVANEVLFMIPNLCVLHLVFTTPFELNLSKRIC